MRLFVSIDLPDRLADDIASVQAELEPAAGIRLTDPTQAHVTLKFLGEVDPARVDDITEALEDAVEQAAVGPFEATIGGLGAFPDPSYISVVWLGVTTGAGAMTELHDAVESAIVDLGFDPADHEFTPHATIARMDHAGGKDRVQRLLREADPTIGAFTVESIALTESTLKAGGPVYETVERIALPSG